MRIVPDGTNDSFGMADQEFEQKQTINSAAGEGPRCCAREYIKGTMKTENSLHERKDFPVCFQKA